MCVVDYVGRLCIFTCKSRKISLFQGIVGDNVHVGKLRTFNRKIVDGFDVLIVLNKFGNNSYVGILFVKCNRGTCKEVRKCIVGVTKIHRLRLVVRLLLFLLGLDVLVNSELIDDYC